MNAYELAEFIETGGENIDRKELANMLRQQADRIRNLQKSLGFKNSGYETINLTPQTKPLSDEEIKEVWLKRPANTAEDVVRFARAIEERHGIK